MSGLVACLMTSALLVLGCARPPTDRPNIIIVLVDALRPDHLGCYGYRLPTSPAIDAFSTEGVVFTEAVSVADWTKPAVPSLLTSLYPSQHGVFEGSASDTEGKVTSDILGESLVTLGEMLQGAGYATAAFVMNAQLKGFLGFQQGFELFAEDLGEASQIIARFLAWLDDRPGDRPFFVYLHFLDVHWPYTPPPPYDTMFGDYTSQLDLAAHDPKALRQRINDGELTLAATDVLHLASQYDGEIRAFDDQFAELYATLKRRHLLEHTWIVLTADHGEEFYEHGKIGHGNSLYEELLRVPLVIRGPSATPGARVSTPVSLIDIVPTALDVAGLPLAPSLMGRSLRRGLEGGALDRRPTFAESRHKYDYARAIRTSGFKYIESFKERSHDRNEPAATRFAPSRLRDPARFSLRRELYRLTDDPLETTDLSEREGAVVSTLAAALDAWAERLEGGYRGESGRRELDPATVEHLRALGYVQ